MSDVRAGLRKRMVDDLSHNMYLFLNFLKNKVKCTPSIAL